MRSAVPAAFAHATPAQERSSTERWATHAFPFVLSWSAVLLSGVSGPSVSACEDLTVRDAAFGEPRDVHRLCLIARPDDARADAIFTRLDGWIKGPGAPLNLELVRTAPDDPEIDWRKHCGTPSAPPSTPVVVLAGRQKAKDRTFFIQYWEPAPTDDDLKALLTSPAREALRREVVRSVAVMLYIRGTDADAGRAEPLIETVQEAWVDRGPLGVSVVRVDRTDAREKILLSFTGVEREGPDWITVVFGHGKFMPPLIGDDISEAELTKMVESVAAECTCLQTAGGMGVDIPMIWDQRDDALVALMVPPKDDTEVAAKDETQAKAAEIDIPKVEVAAPNVRPALGQSGSNRMLTSLLWVLVAAVVFTGIATVAILSRKNRGSAGVASTTER